MVDEVTAAASRKLAPGFKDCRFCESDGVGRARMNMNVSITRDGGCGCCDDLLQRETNRSATVWATDLSTGSDE